METFVYKKNDFTHNTILDGRPMQSYGTEPGLIKILSVELKVYFSVINEYNKNVCLQN